MLGGDITQGASRAEIADGVAWSVTQDIVGYTHESVFLAEHAAVLADEGKSIDIRVNNNTKIKGSRLHLVHDAREILLQRFGIMSEVASGFGIEELILNAKTVEESGKNHSSHTVDTVNTHLESCLADGLGIYEIEIEHRLDVTVVERGVVDNLSEMVNLGIFKVLALSNVEHLIAVVLGEELPTRVEQLESIPLTRIMTGSDDDTTIGLRHGDSQFGGGSCGQTDVEHIESHTHERAADNGVNHLSRHTGITPHNNLSAAVGSVATDECGISRCKLNDVKRIEGVACATADGSANTGYRLDECHIYLTLNF